MLDPPMLDPPMLDPPMLDPPMLDGRGDRRVLQQFAERRNGVPGADQHGPDVVQGHLEVPETPDDLGCDDLGRGDLGRDLQSAVTLLIRSRLDGSTGTNAPSIAAAQGNGGPQACVVRGRG
ncbi:hypothetical protein [Candidatus Frankia alpina]|uniref:hypothetical protein n=1 Tax=Candidatus Frankia alpina TaxID=2699483 RepID=UPI001A99ED86|nr:hypothetical protein [Candidatus Frankia alpina]